MSSTDNIHNSQVNVFNSCIDQEIGELSLVQMQQVVAQANYKNVPDEEAKQLAQPALQRQRAVSVKAGTMPAVSKEICLEKAKNWKPLASTDDYRCDSAYKSGGFPLDDAEVINKYRAAFKGLLNQIGRQLIMGRFNLTNTSFPISCMAPSSIVQVYASVAGPQAPYLTMAALSDDPITRMKHVMASSIAYLHPCHSFDKPLNPILGETFQAKLADGSTVNVE